MTTPALAKEINRVRHYPTPDGLVERFLSKVDRTESCWVWVGNRHKKGYGQFYASGKLMHAHRWSWTLLVGPIPEGLHVLHKCDNRPCVNPDHLYLGTNDDNVRDRVERGRSGGAKGVKNPRAKLTDEQVADIRRRHVRNAHYPHPGSSGALAREYGVGTAYICDLVSSNPRARREVA